MPRQARSTTDAANDPFDTGSAIDRQLGAHAKAMTLLQGARETPMAKAMRKIIMSDIERSTAEWLAQTGKRDPAELNASITACVIRNLLDFIIGLEGHQLARITEVNRKIDEQGRLYKGVWKPGTYTKGSFVTHNGSMFHADNTTDLKPGEGGGWTLAVKRGVDGKDAR